MEDGDDVEGSSPIPEETQNNPKFPAQVTTILERLYSSGMTGWGKDHGDSIDTAIATTGLQAEQIKNWIRRRNRKRKAAEDLSSTSLPKVKQHLSKWQCFAKKFAKTEEGKVAKVVSNAHFQREASKYYGMLSEEEKTEYVREISPEVEMTKQDIVKKARKIMNHIHEKFVELEVLGFRGFAVSFGHGKSHLVGSESALSAIKQQHLTYLHTLVFYGAIPLVGEKLVTNESSQSASSAFATSTTANSSTSALKSTTKSTTKSATISATKSATASATKSATASATKSATASATKSATASATKSATVSATKSATASATISATTSATKSATASATKSATTSATKSATTSETKSCTPVTETATISHPKSATISTPKSATKSAPKSAIISATQSAITSATKAATTSVTQSSITSAAKPAPESATTSATQSATTSVTKSSVTSVTKSASISAPISATKSTPKSAITSATKSATTSATQSVTKSAITFVTQSSITSAIKSAPKSSITSATHSATTSVTKSSITAAITSATHSATSSATKSSIISAITSATHSATTSATKSSITSAIKSATHSATTSATKSSITSAITSATHSATTSATKFSITSATKSAPKSATTSATQYMTKFSITSVTESAATSAPISATKSAPKSAITSATQSSITSATKSAPKSGTLSATQSMTKSSITSATKSAATLTPLMHKSTASLTKSIASSIFMSIFQPALFTCKPTVSSTPTSSTFPTSNSTSTSLLITQPSQTSHPEFMPTCFKSSSSNITTYKPSAIELNTSELPSPKLFVSKSSVCNKPSTSIQKSSTSGTSSATELPANSIHPELFVLLTDQWLNDYVIDSAQRLLKQQFCVCGLQSSLRGQNLSFNVLALDKKYVQILHTNKNHWVTVTNINVYLDRGEKDRVQIFDSMIPMKIGMDVKKQVCSFVRPLASKFRFDIMNISPQSNGNDCGLYAIANAVELSCGSSPINCQFDTHVMRKHLLQCLKDQKMEPFPKISKRHVRFGCAVKYTEEEDILCICRMPRGDNTHLISCSMCHLSFHASCVKVCVNDFCNKQWFCSKCKIF